MTKQNRPAAFIMALALLFVVFFSTFYIVENAGHNCIGDGCPICRQISVCENTLRSIASAARSVAAAVFIPVLCSLSTGAFSAFFFSDTLVSLKVKLSN